MHFYIAFKKKYRVRFVATQIVSLADNIMGSDLLMRTSEQSCKQWTRIPMKILKQEVIPDELEGLNGGGRGSKILCICCLHNIRLRMATIEELSTIIKPQATLWNTWLRQLRSRRCYFTPVWKRFLGDWKLCVTITLQTVVVILLIFWAIPSEICTQKASPFATVFQLLASTKFGHKEEAWISDGLFWRSSTSNHSICAEGFLVQQYCITGDGGDQKNCW